MSNICTPEFNDQTRKLQEKAKALREQLKATQRDATRLEQLEKQSAELRQAKGPYSKVNFKSDKEYGEAVKKAQLERDRLRAQADELIAKGERLSQSPAKKVLATAHNLQMAMILASKVVYEHLAYAVGGGHIGSLIADVTRSAAKHTIPGLKGIAEKAPRYGQGISWKAFKDRVQGAKEAPRQAFNQIWHGAADREVGGKVARHSTDEFYSYLGTLSEAIKTPGVLNKAMETTRAISGYVGRTHAATKEFLTQPEFRETVGRETRYLEKNLEKQGVPPEKAADFMQRESTQATLASKGVAQAFTEKMQGKNIINSAVDRWVGALEKSDSVGANALAGIFKAVEPVRKIGVNIADRQVSNLAGAGRALVDVMQKGDMTPERADRIMFNIGRQGVGATMLAVGVLYYAKMGGVPGVFTKKEQPQLKDEKGNPIKPGESEFLPKEAFHGDVFALVQIGASMMQVYEKEHGKEKGVQLALDVLGRPTYNWFERTIPYTDTARRTASTLEYGRGWGEVLGNILRSHVVPGFVQQKARDEDPYKGFRKQKSISDDLKVGIPGHGISGMFGGREDVPKR
jgi:hypothetical protein